MSHPALVHRHGDFRWDDAFPLLPEQFAETARALEAAEPERRLLLAVLCDAIVVFQKRAVGFEGPASRSTNEAERWILSDDRRWLFSFVNVCDALDITSPTSRFAVRCSRGGGASGRLDEARPRAAGSSPAKSRWTSPIPPDVTAVEVGAPTWRGRVSPQRWGALSRRR
jgi:hypothetical protein